MVAVIVAAHGRLAEGLIASSAMIAGPQEDLVAVTFDPSEGPDDLLAKYTAAVEKSPSDRYLILVDLLGGSPYNAAARFAAEREDADVVTGVNLPMLVEVLGRRLTGGSLPELVDTARTAGAGGVKVLSEIFTPTTNESLGAEAILAVSDGAANDELRKTLMLQTGGGKVKVHVLGVEKAGRVYKNPKYDSMKAVIVVETPADIVRLLDLGVEADEVNVGGMTFKQGTKALSQAVYISDEDVKAFQEIDRRGVTQYIQQVPSTGRTDLMSALKSKGFIS